MLLPEQQYLSITKGTTPHCVASPSVLKGKQCVSRARKSMEGADLTAGNVYLKDGGQKGTGVSYGSVWINAASASSWVI